MTQLELFKRKIKIKKLLKDGKSHLEIASRFGLRIEYIGFVEKFKRIFDPTVPDNAAKEDKQILRMLRQGDAPEKISRQLAIPAGHIRQVGMDHGIIKSIYERKTGERNKKILELLRQGWSLPKIGRQYNISRERVRQIGARYGVKCKKTHLTDKNAVFKLAKQEHPLSQIAQKFNLTVNSIRRILIESGIDELQPRYILKKKTAKRNEQIVKAIKKGMTYEAAALKFNLSKPHIGIILRKNGIRQRPLRSEFKQRHKRIKQLAKEGKSTKEIALIMRMHRGSVSQIKRIY